MSAPLHHLRTLRRHPAGRLTGDGTNWTQAGSTQTIDLDNTAEVGLVATAHAGSTTQTSVFTNVVVTGTQSVSDDPRFAVTYQTLNNLGQATTVATYEGDNVAITDANSDGMPDAPASSYRRSYVMNFYDDQGRSYGSDTYSVDPADGTISSASLSSKNWFDRRGNVIKSLAPSGLVTKNVFDANRLTNTFSTDGGGDSS